MTNPTPGAGGRRSERPPTADELIELAEELADLAMGVEDDGDSEQMIAIAARIRSAAFAGVDAKTVD